MKKIISAFLVFAMLFLLSACGKENISTEQPSGGESQSTEQGKTGEYDREITIYVGDSDEWTPFPNTTGVEYSNSEDAVIEILALEAGKTVYFEGLSPGESIITATLNGETKTAFVTVQGQNRINYHYDAPTAFLCKYANFEKGNAYSEKDIELFACLNGALLEYHGDIGESGVWYYYPGGPNPSNIKDGNEWQKDEEWSENISVERPQYVLSDPYPLNAFNKGFAEHSGYDPNDYYIGNETVLGISCWVFDISRLNSDSGNRFWVNPNNGHTLKVEKDSDIYEVIEYEPQLESWPDNTIPQ